MLKTALKKVIELSVLGLYRVGSENYEPYKKPSKLKNVFLTTLTIYKNWTRVFFKYKFTTQSK